MRTTITVVVATVLAACAHETVEQRVLRETAASLLEHFAYDGYPQTFPEIAQQLRREAEAGNVRSQTRLGELYLYGFGVPQDEVERVRWHRKAAEGGAALSQYFLAWNYLEGNAVEQDYRQALEWLRRSAAQGFGVALEGGSAQAQYDCLRPKKRRSEINAEAVASTDPEAKYSKLRSFSTKWIDRHFMSGVTSWHFRCDTTSNEDSLEDFFRAANDGFAKAQYLIGVAYLSGRGIRADSARAAHWFLKAARQDHVPARREYCALYWAGKTAPADGPPNSTWCEGIREP
ncbi:MAG: sel1 repeat family protein [Rhodospirillales bacterium]|nr:sel1 repeat family protein [Rhodospirillales bacterium]